MSCVAIYVFKMKTFSRSAGSRGSKATSAAAYRAGERIRDERTDTVYDHRRRQDVLHKEIILPAELAARGSTPQWGLSRSALWNAAERAETRRNSRVAREFTLALPHELTPAARRQLAQRFAHQLSDRYGTAIDLVIHAPRNDPRNFHAHLLSTTREVTARGLGRKAALELSGTERHRRGLARWSQEKTWLRERWAEYTNEALREAHLQVQVSHQGPAIPDLTRSPWLPIAAYYMEKQGRHSFLAERIRTRHQARLAAERSPPSAGVHRWLDRLREHARTAWLGLREQLREQLRDRSAIATVNQRMSLQPEIAAARAAQPAMQPASRSAAQSLPAPAYTRPYVPSLDDAALESLRNWQAYRQSHPELNRDLASESLRNWRDYRQRSAERGMEREHGPDRHREQAPHGRSAAEGRERDLGHDYDLSL